MRFDFSSLDNIDLGVIETPKANKPNNKTVNKIQKQEEKPQLKEKIKEDKIINNKKNDNIIDFIKNLSEKEIKAKISDTVSNLKLIKKELNDKFIERENEIEMLLIALVSGTNAFLHGPAGTGKSLLTEELSNRIINSNYFRILMGKTTEPAEVFGSVSISSMKDDIYKVNTHGKLPWAHIAFTDECFKANSAVLNSFLTIMNEKLFFNDKVEEVPLITLVGASNEFPEEDNLAALYDRFLLRWHVNYIQDIDNRMDLFNNFLDGRKFKSKLYTKEVAATSVETTVELNDLMLVIESCKEVDIPIKILQAYNMLFLKLEKEGIVISDRRKNESLKVIQASAILNNRTTASSRDLEPLKYCLWNEPKELQIVCDIVNEIANPDKIKYDNYASILKTFKNELEEIERRKDSADYDYDKRCKVQQINKELNYAISDIDKLIQTMDESDSVSFKELRNNMTEYLEEVKSRVIDEFF